MTEMLQYENLLLEAMNQPDARTVLADYWEEKGRLDVAKLWRDDLLVPRAPRQRWRIEKLLSDNERVAIANWTMDQVGTTFDTDPADRALFEAAICACYRLTGLVEPKVIWVESPIVGALVSVIYDVHLIDTGVNPVRAGHWGNSQARNYWADWGQKFTEGTGFNDHALHINPAVSTQIRGLIANQWRPAKLITQRIQRACDEALSGPIPSTIRRNIMKVLCAHAVDHDYVLWSQHETNLDFWYLSGPLGIRVHQWENYYPGQFASDRYPLLLIDKLRLNVSTDFEKRVRALNATSFSAGFWWPGTKFVVACDRPLRFDIDGAGAVREITFRDGWVVA